MELDEDVVFNDSPLARYLQESGMTVETEERMIDWEEEMRLGPIDRVLMAMRRSLIALDGALNPAFVWEVARMEELRILTESQLMLPEDLHLVKAAYEVNREDHSTAWRTALKGIEEILATAASSTLLWFLPEWSNKIKAVACVIPPAILIWRWKGMIGAVLEKKALAGFISNAEKCHRSLKKAEKEIHDHSLISRGYLMGRRDHFIWNLHSADITEMCQRSRSHLRELRRAVYEKSLRLAIEFSTASDKLRLERPLPAGLDHQGFFLPDVITEVERGLIKLDDENFVPSITNLNWSSKLYTYKKSEYLRRLGLAFAFLTDYNVAKVSIPNSLVECVCTSSQSINILLVIYSCLLGKVPPRKASHICNSAKLMYDIKVLLHDQHVHGLEALYTVRDFEEKLERCETENVDHKDLEVYLESISHHLQSAMHFNCKTKILVSKLMNKSREESIDRTPRDEDRFVLDGDSHEEEKIYIPQDEILELYVRESEQFSELCEDEDQNAVIDPHVLRNVMMELKNVIKERARIWMEKEKVILKKKTSSEDSNTTLPEKVENAPSTSFVDTNLANCPPGHESVDSVPVDIDFGSLAAEATAKARAFFSDNSPLKEEEYVIVDE